MAEETDTFSKKYENALSKCLKSYSNKNMLSRRTEGLRIMMDLKHVISNKTIEMDICVNLINCSLNIITYFFSEITVKECLKGIPKLKIKNLDFAIKNFEEIVTKLSSFSKVIKETIITYFNTNNLWLHECLCEDILRSFATNDEKFYLVGKTLLDILDNTNKLEKINEKRIIVRSLHQILKINNFKITNIETVNVILSVFKKHFVHISEEDKQLKPLSAGVQHCVSDIIKNVSNAFVLKIIKTLIHWASSVENDDLIYNFGTILQFASDILKVNVYSDTFTSDLFIDLIFMLGNSNTGHTLLGQKTLQNLLDRNNNTRSGLINIPRIYFQEFQYPIYVPEINHKDLEFIMEHRQILHEMVMLCVLLHGVS